LRYNLSRAFAKVIVIKYQNPAAETPPLPIMLDENLPTFRFKQSADNPLSDLLYFTQNGADPAAEYLFRRADPALPTSRNKYAVALCDPLIPDVIYGEVLVEPEWSQPTLSAAELRAQQQSGAPPATTTAMVPESFMVQLYNPDQSISIKMVQGGFTKSDSWEFEMPVQTFRQPTASELDRQQSTSPADLVPRIMFRWKKDGRLSKDLTCYMSGTSLGGRKNKEPDITVALFRAARDSVVTIYEPNLHRVEVEDRKGFEVVLLLGAEVIKDMWIVPKMDVFNVQGGGGSTGAVNSGRRKNSRPINTTAAAISVGPAPIMSGANRINSGPPAVRPPPSAPPSYTSTNATLAAAIPANAGASSAEIEAETRRLKAMVEREEREREKKEKVEQKRIKKMLEEEEKERRKREAEVAKETERLRKKYGVDGQEIPPLPPRNPTVNASPNASSRPPQTQQFFAPPPTAPVGGPPPHFFKQVQQGLGHLHPPALPPRPVSAGPGTLQGGQQSGPFHCARLNAIWNGPGGNGWGITPPPHLATLLNQQQPSRPAPRQRRGSGGAPYMEDRPNHSSREDDRKRVQKKRSSHW